MLGGENDLQESQEETGQTMSVAEKVEERLCSARFSSGDQSSPESTLVDRYSSMMCGVYCRQSTALIIFNMDDL